MKRQVHSLLAITCSLAIGLIVSAAISGCQPPSAPPAPQPSGRSNVTDGAVAPQGEVEPSPTADPGEIKPEVPPSTPPMPEPKGPDKPTTDPSVTPPEVKSPGTSDTSDLKVPSENPKLVQGDWNQWLGFPLRNNVPVVDNDKVPTSWAPGEYDDETKTWSGAENIKWVVRLGSQTYGNPVVAGGRVYVGTNNGGGYLKRYPDDYDLGCLIAFDEKTGNFLWQDSSEKLPTGRVHDWPLMGICCAPLVEGDKVWFVTSRGEVKCLDAAGFHDDEDDGPMKNQTARLFDVLRTEDGPDIIVAPIVKELDAGKLPEALRQHFTDAGFELPAGEIAVTAKEAGKSWTFQTEVAGANRDVSLMVQGPRLSAFKVIAPADKEESDVVWSVDMMRELGTSQHNMCSCSVTSWGDLLFVNTGNGVHEDHKTIPAPQAPSFVCMNKHTGEVIWTDSSPGANILHGQWSSPTVAIIDDVPQVIFAGGDGWVYSFQADVGQDGKPELLWKFDINEKNAKLELGSRGKKNDPIATPVVYDNKVYFATGQDPEHGEGEGIFWCIDPTQRGDISESLVTNVADPDKTVPVKRVQAAVEAEGDRIIPNPNSGVVWKLREQDWNGDGEIADFEEKFHRGIGSAAIKDDLLFVSDFSGLFFCIDAQTGKVHWAHDMLAASWGSALIAGDKVFAGDEDGDILVFNLSKEAHEPLAEVNMDNAVFSSPIMANGVLYIANKNFLFAIEKSGEPAAAAAESAE